MMTTLIAHCDWRPEEEEFDTMYIDKAASYHTVRLNRLSARFFAATFGAIWGRSFFTATHPKRKVAHNPLPVASSRLRVFASNFSRGLLEQKIAMAELFDPRSTSIVMF
jgi:hypothetical protein